MDGLVTEPALEHHPLPATASKHQILYFDAVRALSAQMVLVGHSFNLFFPGIFMVLSHGRFRTSGGIFYMQNLGLLLFLRPPPTRPGWFAVVAGSMEPWACSTRTTRT